MSNRTDPRALAVKALCRVDSDKAYSNITLNSVLKEHELSKEDKALCTSVFYGTLDRRITIDHILKMFINKGFNKLKPFTLNLLRSAVFQIVFMEKIPVSAAVNESVKIIKASKESYNSGFVNGVLRNIARENIALPSGDSVAELSVRYSCPEWLVSELLGDYSVDTVRSFLENTLLPPPTYIRVNTRKTDVKVLSEELSEYGININTTPIRDCLLISGYSSIEALSLYKKGHFFVQDISCQSAVGMLGISAGDLVLDMCSAPGGKTFTAALSADNVAVTATDLYDHRVSLVKSGAERLGLPDITSVTADAEKYFDGLGVFDKIICDVPCSGLGVLRRKPDIKYREPGDLEKLADIQLGILSNADRYLKSGGRILYSTCTLRKRENEDIVNAFLAQHAEYKVLDSRTFLPSDGNGDGFFAAVLQKD